MLFAVVEDNIHIAQIVTMTLQMQDHSVMHFPDGASFFASLQTTAYDFVLVDFNLPGRVSGLQVITFLQESMPRVPVLVVSGADDSVLKSLQTLYPRLTIVRKPFRVQALLQSIATPRKSH
jgi:DNA-binding response OmpR family regulator